jgi:hypothetical protein
MSDLWAITAYFNPTGGTSRRLANYRIFRERLAAPLVAVELAYGAAFELREGDAEILIQIRGGDVMWQKERLLNVALAALPASCSKVAWLDGDVVFGSEDWVEQASRRLDDTPLLQPFSRAHYLSKDALSGQIDLAQAESTRLSVAFTTASTEPVVNASTGKPIRRHPPGLGLAWAARREILDKHGLYDACIVGGGDRAIIAAAAGGFAELMDRQHMNEAQRRRYLAWAEPFHATVSAVDAHLDGDLFHLWHGSFTARSYANRHAGLESFDFDPFSDIAFADNGAWRWNSEKPALHAYVREYFLSRLEDR